MHAGGQMGNSHNLGWAPFEFTQPRAPFDPSFWTFGHFSQIHGAEEWRWLWESFGSRLNYSTCTYQSTLQPKRPPNFHSTRLTWCRHWQSRFVARACRCGGPARICSSCSTPSPTGLSMTSPLSSTCPRSEAECSREGQGTWTWVKWLTLIFNPHLYYLRLITSGKLLVLVLSHSQPKTFIMSATKPVCQWCGRSVRARTPSATPASKTLLTQDLPCSYSSTQIITFKIHMFQFYLTGVIDASPEEMWCVY